MEHTEYTFEDLKQCFKEAIQKGSAFIGVLKEKPEIDGNDLIVTFNEDFVDKLAYYAQEYTNKDNLKHRFKDDVRIVGFAYGESLGEIQQALGRM